MIVRHNFLKNCTYIPVFNDAPISTKAHQPCPQVRSCSTQKSTTRENPHEVENWKLKLVTEGGRDYSQSFSVHR